MDKDKKDKDEDKVEITPESKKKYKKLRKKIEQQKKKERKLGVEKIIKLAKKRKQQWGKLRKGKFDGVKGKLPDWILEKITEEKAEEFTEAQYNLLCIGRRVQQEYKTSYGQYKTRLVRGKTYSPTEIKKFIKTLLQIQNQKPLEVGEEAGEDYHSFDRIPNQRELIPHLEVLIKFQTAVKLGEKKGPGFLIGEEDAKSLNAGRKNIKALSEAREKRIGGLSPIRAFIKQICDFAGRRDFPFVLNVLKTISLSEDYDEDFDENYFEEVERVADCLFNGYDPIKIKINKIDLQNKKISYTPHGREETTSTFKNIRNFLSSLKK